MVNWHFDDYKRLERMKTFRFHSFVDKMDLVYAAADMWFLVQGASSVSELYIVSKPVVLFLL
jgi:UDP-N-acetylglucosamine--N-acetylmuramyl-(pentapeptide) pyrophosphoryl-undecaprenol N-acetylglucosamine transferase